MILDALAAAVPISFLVVAFAWILIGVNRKGGGDVDNYTLLRGMRDREERARLSALNSFLHNKRGWRR